MVARSSLIILIVFVSVAISVWFSLGLISEDSSILIGAVAYFRVIAQFVSEYGLVVLIFGIVPVPSIFVFVLPETVAEHPFLAVAVAFALGMTVAIAIRRSLK
jgi:hypothetical protein